MQISRCRLRRHASRSHDAMQCGGGPVGRVWRAAAHIITIVLDDVAIGTLVVGAEIRTPAMDSLATAGLRYVHFDTESVRASTRASMLTGVTATRSTRPRARCRGGAGKRPQHCRLFRVPGNAQNMAKVPAEKQGYATWAVGKWHLIPMDELGPDAGREHWPLQRGFDYFYGFPRGWK